MASKSTVAEESSKCEIKLPPVVTIPLEIPMTTKSTVVAGSSRSAAKLPPVVVRKELQILIGTVKELGQITTYEEVLEGLGKYILKNKLFDERNPYRIRCKDDELGSVLGIEEFTMSDLKSLLQKITIPVNKTYKNSVIKDPPVIKPAEAASLHSDNPLKRKLDESVDSDKKKVVAVDTKTCSTAPMVIHIPPSPKYVNESDSVESAQGYETAFVKDTSDDDLSLNSEHILAVEETFNIEYEVESDTSSDSDDSSDSEDEGVNPVSMMLLNAAIMTYLSKPESDIEFFADDSSVNDSDDDVEISEFDFWTCKTCKVANKPPMRYCLKCFNERLNWLPDKERKRKPRRPARSSNKDTSGASSSQNYMSSQESIQSAISTELKQITSANTSSVGMESSSSPYATSTDLPCSESSDMPCMDTAGLPSINYLGSQCTESISSPYFKPEGPCIMDPNDPLSMDSEFCSIQPKSSFCMKSMGTFFDGFATDKNCSNTKSLNSSSLESSSLTSLESSSSQNILKSLNFSSMEYASSSSIKSSDSAIQEYTYSSSIDNSGSSNAEPAAKVCIICCKNLALASIIHGKFAHQITCFDCGRKIKKQNLGCPLCRRPVERVVHQIVL